MVPGLCVSLDQVGLATVLSILEIERRSGIVEVQHARCGRGRILLLEGRAVRASTSSGAGDLGGRAAVEELLRWTVGELQFWTAVVRGEDEIGCSTTQLLLEAAQHADELAA